MASHIGDFPEPKPPQDNVSNLTKSTHSSLESECMEDDLETLREASDILEQSVTKREYARI